MTFNHPFTRIMDGGSVVATFVRPLVPNFQVQLTYLNTDVVVLSKDGMLKAVQLSALVTDKDVGKIIPLSKHDAKVIEVCKSKVDESLAFLIRKEDDMNQYTEDEIVISALALKHLGESLMPVLTGQKQPETLDEYVYFDGEACDCINFNA